MSLDVPTATPPPASVERVRGVVALTPSPAREEVAAVVQAYLRALVGGDVAAIAPLLAEGARRVGVDGSADLAESLSRRMRGVDYSRVAADRVTSHDAIRVSSYETIGEGVRLRSHMQEGDLLVDVPVLAQRAGAARVFGPSMRLVLRRGADTGEWKIAAVEEDAGPWP